MNNWHLKSAEEVAALLDSNLYAGLSRKEAAARRSKGKNILFPQKKRTLADYFAEFLFTFMPLLLLITAVAAFLSERTKVGLILLVTLVFHLVLLFAAYYKARRVLDKLEDTSEAAAKVIRSGKLYLTPSENLVTGDLILLNKGDVVPADCRLIGADSLVVRESGITQNKLASKNPFACDGDNPQNSPCMLWAGCAVEEGSGRAIVCAIGEATFLSQTKEKVRDTALENTPFMIKLKKLSATVSGFLLGFLFLFAVVSFLPFTPLGILDGWMLGCAFAASAMSEFYVVLAYITVGNALFGALEMKNTPLFGQKKAGKVGGFSGGTLIRKPGRLDKIASVDRLILSPSLFTVNASYTLSSVVDPTGRSETVNESLSASAKSVLRNAALAMGDPTGRALAAQSTQDAEEKRALLSEALAKGMVFAGKETTYTLLGNGVSEGGIFYGLVERDGNLFVTLLAPCDRLLSSCAYCLMDNKIEPLTPSGAKAIAAYASSAERRPGERPAVAIGMTDARALTLLGRALRDEDLLALFDNTLVYEGLLVFEKQMQKDTQGLLATAKEAGIGVTLFCENEAELDVAAYFGFALVSKENPDRFGPLVAFGPMTLAEKRELVRAYRQKGQRVACLGHTLAELSLLREADVAITCGASLASEAMIEIPVGQTAQDAQEKELRALGRFGCDALRATADLMVSPASLTGKGGFASLLEAFFCAKALFCNMSAIVRYLFTLLGAKALLTFASLLSGMSFVSPSFLVLTGLLYDFTAVMILALRRPDSRHLFYRHSEKRLLGQAVHALLLGLGGGAVILAFSLLASMSASSSLLPFVRIAVLLFSLIAFLFCTWRRRAKGSRRSASGLGMTLLTLLLLGGMLATAHTAFSVSGWLLLLLALLVFVGLQILLRLWDSKRKLVFRHKKKT